MNENVSILNFVDMCSSAMLSIIDGDECAYDDGFIMVDGKFRDMFEFYLTSGFNSSYVFGKHNVIVNTCMPSCNWRKVQRGEPLEHGRYFITENGSSMISDIEGVNKLLDYSWSRLSRTVNMKRKFKFMQMHELDGFDLISLIEEILDVHFSLTPYHYYLIGDANIEYAHYRDIPEYLKTEVTIELRRHGLL